MFCRQVCVVTITDPCADCTVMTFTSLGRGDPRRLVDAALGACGAFPAGGRTESLEQCFLLQTYSNVLFVDFKMTRCSVRHLI